MTRALPEAFLDVSISHRPSKPPPYIRRAGRGTLYAQVKLNTGKLFVTALRTRSEQVAVARMAPLLGKLISQGKLDRHARVCQIYLLGRCPACSRAMPGGI
jgi:hypothetical protein